jgi:ketosteroid isomerase-like protein
MMRTSLTLILSLLGLMLTAASAQTKRPTKEDVEHEIRRLWAAQGSGNVDVMLPNAGRGINFGWRRAPMRTGGWAVDPKEVAAHGDEAYRQVMRRFYDSMEYYHCNFEELHTSVEGDIGLGWGVYVEDFKPKGQPAERARVRLTMVLKKEGERWRTLMRHSDIEPFDENGRYLPQLTTVR